MTDDRGAAPAPAVADSERRRTLVRIAYRHIATRGFEGLRVRAVAHEAGINHATLLHHYPTKEALIGGVVEYLLHEFSVTPIPRPHEGEATPAEEVRLQFEDMRWRLRERPEIFVVLIELLARSLRDPAIAAALRGLDTAWLGYLVGLLRRGVAMGAFRADLDPYVVATALMAQIKGLGMQAIGQADTAQLDALVTQLAAQVERWLVG